jgi:hypothetical protein
MRGDAFAKMVGVAAICTVSGDAMGRFILKHRKSRWIRVTRLAPLMTRKVAQRFAL